MSVTIVPTMSWYLHYGNQVKTVDASHRLQAFEDNVNQDLTWQVIETRADAPDGSDGIGTGYVEADIENVKIRQVP